MLDDETKKLPANLARARNDYDNTVSMVDSFIFQVIEMLRKISCERPVWCIYVSDHGETPRQPWRNATSHDLWELPMILWVSENYKVQFPELVRTAMANHDTAIRQNNLYWNIFSFTGLSIQGNIKTDSMF